jgi:hypothetical protein
VVTTLLQVHHDVEERHLITSLGVQRLKVAGQNILVIFPANKDRHQNFNFSTVT